MKSFFLMAGLVLLVASCSKDTDVNLNEQEKQTAPVSVHVDDFNVSVEPISTTRGASKVADYSGINAITLAFYKSDNSQEYKNTQLKSDHTTYTTFGDFNLSLQMGSYTMVVVAYYTNEYSPFTLISPVEASYTGARARETFTSTQTVNITSTKAVDISATLSRIISQLTVISTDNKTANVSNVRMTLSGGSKSFNPTTGLATDNAGFSNTVSSSAAVGATSSSSTCLFLATDEQTMNVTIETLDADGNAVFSTMVEDVPFKRNSVTKLTGSLYTNSGIAGAFQINTDWLPDTNVSF